MRVYGEAAVAKSAKKHPASRKLLQRFLEIAREADWPHFPARADFEEQMLFIQRILTHEEYVRENF